MKNSKNSSSSKSKSSTTARTSTPVRNSAVPKAMKSSAAVSNGSPSQEQIAKRAFELYASGVAGSETDHWFRAERELRSGL
jgi:hypothetical protein